jgi:hypothetical protein
VNDSSLGLRRTTGPYILCRRWIDSRRFAVNSWYLIHRLVNLVYHGPDIVDKGERSPRRMVYPQNKIAPIHSDNMLLFVSDAVCEWQKGISMIIYTQDLIIWSPISLDNSHDLGFVIVYILERLGLADIFATYQSAGKTWRGKGLWLR